MLCTCMHTEQIQVATAKHQECQLRQELEIYFCAAGDPLSLQSPSTSEFSLAEKLTGNERGFMLKLFGRRLE